MSLNHSVYSQQSAAGGVEFSCVSFAPEPGVAGLRLSGELDLAASALLGEALLKLDDAVVVIVDLRQVTFMDSSGLHTILRAHARLSEANRHLALVPGPPAVQRIFELTGTNRVLTFAEAPDAGDQPSGDQPSSNGRSRDGTTRSGGYVLGPMLWDKLTRARALQ